MPAHWWFTNSHPPEASIRADRLSFNAFEGEAGPVASLAAREPLDREDLPDAEHQQEAVLLDVDLRTLELLVGLSVDVTEPGQDLVGVGEQVRVGGRDRAQCAVAARPFLVGRRPRSARAALEPRCPRRAERQP